MPAAVRLQLQFELDGAHTSDVEVYVRWSRNCTWRKGMHAHLPWILAVEANDNDGVELRLARVRVQAAAVRALADHVERLTRLAAVGEFGEQLVPELTRLGCWILEAAGSLANSPSDNEASTQGK